MCTCAIFNQKFQRSKELPCISGVGKGVYGESPCPISQLLEVGIVILLGDMALNRFDKLHVSTVANADNKR